MKCNREDKKLARCLGNQTLKIHQCLSVHRAKFRQNLRVLASLESKGIKLRYNCARNSSKKSSLESFKRRVEANDDSRKKKTRNGEAGVMKV